jgi:hypothetical protein
LVLSDVVMPGMSGPELVEHLHEEQANLAVLYGGNRLFPCLWNHGESYRFRNVALTTPREVAELCRRQARQLPKRPIEVLLALISHRMRNRFDARPPAADVTESVQHPHSRLILPHANSILLQKRTVQSQRSDAGRFDEFRQEPRSGVVPTYLRSRLLSWRQGMCLEKLADKGIRPVDEYLLCRFMWGLPEMVQ